MPIPSNWNDLQSWAVSVLRYGRGLIAKPGAQRPAETVILYEFEACPYCRKVREVLSELDLDYVSYPCARGSAHRDEVIARGGKAQFPYLVDPGQGVAMYESEAIITHLVRHYGSGRRGLGRLLAPLNTLSGFVASAVRGRGARVRPGAAARGAPARLLELYNFEASPYCRKAREALAELDLPYLAHNLAKRSPRRHTLVERGGKMMVPYLVDPNGPEQGVEMYESDDIVAYLHRTYGGGS